MDCPTILQEVSRNTMQKLFISIYLILFSMLWSTAHAADEDVTPLTSSYVSLGEPMVLNLTSKTKRLTFLQISADVLVSDSDVEDTIKTHVPAIRHSLILLLSERDAVDIKSTAKREEIRQQATTNVMALLAELSGNPADGEILFSSILVQ